MDKLLKALGVLVLSVSYIFYRLFVLIKIYGYIAVKMFGLPHVGMWQMFAISFLFGCFNIEYKKHEKQELDEIGIKYASLFAILSLCWLFAYLYFG